jgi:drug/metabolite transporter (DMT)-like permease
MSLTPRLALLLTLPPLMWAGNAVVGRLLVPQVPPLRLNALRWLLALAILLPLGWRAFGSAERRQALARRWRHLALLGLFGVGAYNALQYLALRTSTPVSATLIAASLPVWMMLVGALVYRVRPAPRDLLGAALSLAGAVVVITRGEPATLAQLQFVAGDLLMVAAAISWAAYSWLLARPPASMSGHARPDWTWAEFLCIQMAVGLLWATLGAAGEAALAPPVPVQWTPARLAGLLFVATGPSLVAYRCWGLGVAGAGPAMAAFFANLTPLFAALLSAALLGEGPRGYHVLGFVLIVAGIVASSRVR